STIPTTQTSPELSHALHLCPAVVNAPIAASILPWYPRFGVRSSCWPKASVQSHGRAGARRPGQASGAPDHPESGRKFKPMVAVATCDQATFSPNGRYGTSAGGPLLRLDVRRPDHLAPF